VGRIPAEELPVSSFSYPHLSLLAEPNAELDAADFFPAEAWDLPAADGWGTPVTDGWDAPAPDQWQSFAPDADDLSHGEGWRMYALCAETDPEAFFPDKGGSTREAKLVCRGCPVRGDCLEYALANEERFGIWGGLSERERRRVRQQRRMPLSA
jgi:WhiB family transcriptional regulator, redox-sensing transcriptional regulator